MRCDNEAAHAEIASVLWDSPSDADCVVALNALSAERLAAWEVEESEASQRSSDERSGRGGEDGEEALGKEDKVEG